MSIKITVQKEVTIDLNAYYPNFPRSLRTAIDEAIMALLSGDKAKPFSKSPSPSKKWQTENDGFPLTHPQRKFRVGKPPAKGKLRALHATIHDYFQDEEISLTNLRDCIEGQGVPHDQITTTISNLWRCDALQINRLN